MKKDADDDSVIVDVDVPRVVKQQANQDNQSGRERKVLYSYPISLWLI